MKKRTVGMVCVRADAELTVPGSVYDRRCSKCSALVMIAPSGQAYLKANPETVIVCENCLPARYEIAGSGLTGPVEEVVGEMRTMQPNLRRYRN